MPFVCLDEKKLVLLKDGKEVPIRVSHDEEIVLWALGSYCHDHRKGDKEVALFVLITLIMGRPEPDGTYDPYYVEKHDDGTPDYHEMVWYPEVAAHMARISKSGDDTRIRVLEGSKFDDDYDGDLEYNVLSCEYEFIMPHTYEDQDYKALVPKHVGHHFLVRTRIVCDGWYPVNYPAMER
jgi:hypothetical protein